jgi:hypothetical protein
VILAEPGSRSRRLCSSCCWLALEDTGVTLERLILLAAALVAKDGSRARAALP